MDSLILLASILKPTVSFEAEDQETLFKTDIFQRDSREVLHLLPP